MSTEVKKPDAKKKQAKGKPKAPAQHPKYSEMITAAINSLKERNGTSRQKIQKYIAANYNVKDGFETQVRLALKRMVQNGTLIHTKGTGASGSFKLAKPETKKVKKPVKKVATPTKKTVKKTVTKKATPAKKTTPKKDKPAKPTKKATPKKTAAKKPATKKPATKKPVTKKPKTQAKKPAAKKSPKKAAK